MSGEGGDPREELKRYRQYVRKQVGVLLRVLQMLSAGELHVEAERERDDELGMLTVGLNMMSDDIRELVESEKELRQEVARKALEAEAANAALRDAQAQLVQSEKMASLGQLVAGVAHELNNPIGVLYANTRLLQELVARIEQPAANTEVLREQLRRLLDRCGEAASRTKRIVLDLRTFSRLDEAECKSVDLHAGLEATLNLLALREQEGIRFHREFGALPPVECYAGQLNQVFMNLLVNACDALEPGGGGNVTVRTALREARELPSWPGPDPKQAIVQVSIADDGPGVPPEHLERIFDPFYTTKDVGKGMGLGLSISYQIALHHAGRIRVDSTPGGGATFHLEFPLLRS